MRSPERHSKLPQVQTFSESVPGTFPKAVDLPEVRSKLEGAKETGVTANS